MFLTKQQILGARDRVTEVVLVPEWAPEGASAEDAAQASVRVRSLSGKQRDEFEFATYGAGKGVNGGAFINMRARLCAYCMVDEAGSRIFSDAEVALLGERSAKALSRVSAVAQRLSGFTNDDVKELEKNSEPDPSGSSPLTSA